MVFEFLGKTGGGHALKIIKSGFLSERKVYDTPPAPLVEGSKQRSGEGALRILSASRRIGMTGRVLLERE